MTVSNFQSRFELCNLTFVWLRFFQFVSVAVRYSAPFLPLCFVFLHLDSEELSINTSEDVGCSLWCKCNLVRDTPRLLQYWSWLYTDSVSSQFCDEVDDLVLHGSFVFSRHYDIDKTIKSVKIANNKIMNQTITLKKCKHHEVISFHTASALAWRSLTSFIVFPGMVYIFRKIKTNYT